MALVERITRLLACVASAFLAGTGAAGWTSSFTKTILPLESRCAAIFSAAEAGGVRRPNRNEAPIRARPIGRYFLHREADLDAPKLITPNPFPPEAVFATLR